MTTPNFHPSTNLPAYMAQMEAVGYNNEGQQLSRQRRYEEALVLFKKALALKLGAFGSHSIQAALSYNALGECYMNLKQYDLARENLLLALSYRETDGETLDTRVTRDNLGRLCEELGDREGARKHRKNGKNYCAYLTCPSPKPKHKQTFKGCARCTSIFYCSVGCQRADWKRHKQYCEKLALQKDQVANKDTTNSVTDDVKNVSQDNVEDKTQV